MKTRLSLLLSLVALACVALLPGCNRSAPTLSSPPTFVLAWGGMDGRVHTMQSKDGSTWVLPAQVPGPNSSTGASVAHDGTWAWMVLWNSGGQLSYNLGVGGLPSASATEGIRWESSSSTLRTSAVSETPAVAYGNQKWVAAYVGPANAIKIVPSILDSPQAANGDVDLGATARIVSSPGLAYGAGKFVLTYLDATRLVSRTSPDGVTWGPPNTIFQGGPIGPNSAHCEFTHDATVSYAEGAFYAVSRISSSLCAGNTQAGGAEMTVFKSPDGVSWTSIVPRGSGPTVAQGDTGTPSAAFALCYLVMAYTDVRASARNNLVLRIGQPSSCSNPASFTFGAPQSVNVTNPERALAGTIVSVAFGKGPGQ